LAGAAGVSPIASTAQLIPAGTIAQGALARITGDPATADFVKQQAALAARRAARVAQHATIVTAAEHLDIPTALGVDDVAVVEVPVTIAGKGYATVRGTTHVRVQNVAVPRLRATSLLLSNTPTALRRSGVLLSATVERDRTVRVLYDHDNPLQREQRLALTLDNHSSTPAVVHVIEGSAGPDANAIAAGHLATQRFLVRLAQNEGTLVELEPHSRLTLAQAPLPPRTTVTTIVQLRELEGPPLHLTLSASGAGDRAESQQHTKYLVPQLSFERTYTSPGDDLVVSIGQIPLPDATNNQGLVGDYGVVQHVTIHMINEDRKPAAVALYANPRGGSATGTFLIDRMLVQSHTMAPFTYYKLREYVLPALGYITTTILTMPEAGSAYPLNLIVAPDDGSAAPGATGSPVY
jgi:hypothetical protein